MIDNWKPPYLPEPRGTLSQPASPSRILPTSRRTPTSSPPDAAISLGGISAGPLRTVTLTAALANCANAGESSWMWRRAGSYRERETVRRLRRGFGSPKVLRCFSPVIAAKLLPVPCRARSRMPAMARISFQNRPARHSPARGENYRYSRSTSPASSVPSTIYILIQYNTPRSDGWSTISDHFSAVVTAFDRAVLEFFQALVESVHKLIPVSSRPVGCKRIVQVNKCLVPDDYRLHVKDVGLRAVNQES